MFFVKHRIRSRFIVRRNSKLSSNGDGNGKPSFDPVKLVICRFDLPVNPRWRAEGYPREDCWDIDELFSEAVKAGPRSVLYETARRIWWECYWRLLKRYRKGKPFFDVYLIVNGMSRKIEDRERWVCSNILASGIVHGIVPREVLESTYRIYEKLYGKPIAET